jgi:hypothetical protein
MFYPRVTKFPSDRERFACSRDKQAQLAAGFAIFAQKELP